MHRHTSTGLSLPIRRIGVMVLIAASSLAIGVGTSSAKSHHKSKKKHQSGRVSLSSSCKIDMAIGESAGTTVVLPDAQSGTMYGSLSCSSGGLKGAVAFPFTVADSGDTVGTLTAYTASGSFSGKIDLSQGDSSLPTAYQFGNASYSGTFAVRKGTQKYVGAKGKKNKLACTTTDSVHYDCTLKLKATASGS